MGRVAKPDQDQKIPDEKNQIEKKWMDRVAAIEKKLRLSADRKKAAELKPFADSLKDMIEGLTPAASVEKRKAVEDFYWMIEEFKVSLFAQELKTAYPVSAKKLNEEIRRISRMV